MILTVTPAQAAHVAALWRDMQTAEQRTRDAVALLALGHDVPPDAVLSAIDTDAGTLTFQVRQDRDSITPVIEVADGD